MDGIVRLSGAALGVALAAAGLALVGPAAPAYACDGQGWTAPGVGVLQQSTTVPPVEVRGSGAITLPAGGTGTFGITVVNRGAGFRGGVELQVRSATGAGLPALTMEVAGSGGSVKTWRSLAEEGTPGARWYAVDGLSFQSGESSPEFRLGVGADASGARLRIVARVRDAGGRDVGSATVDATVKDVGLRVRSTFPAQLRRADAYREFDVRVENPSARTRPVRAFLSMTGLAEKPLPPAAGHLVASDIRLERLVGGHWQRLEVHPGCDPSPWAQLGAGFDLPAGASRILHLRIRLADSPATLPHPVHYWLSATVAGEPESEATVSGDFVIRPHLMPSPAPTVHVADAPRPAPSSSAVPTSAPTADPPASAEPSLNAEPASLPDTGWPIWPLAVIGTLLLAAGGATLVAVRHRRPT
jgi:hypothetical protein